MGWLGGEAATVIGQEVDFLLAKAAVQDIAASRNEAAGARDLWDRAGTAAGVVYRAGEAHHVEQRVDRPMRSCRRKDRPH